MMPKITIRISKQAMRIEVRDFGSFLLLLVARVLYLLDSGLFFGAIFLSILEQGHRRQ